MTKIWVHCMSQFDIYDALLDINKIKTITCNCNVHGLYSSLSHVAVIYLDLSVVVLSGTTTHLFPNSTLL